MPRYNTMIQYLRAAQKGVLKRFKGLTYQRLLSKLPKKNFVLAHCQYNPSCPLI